MRQRLLLIGLVLAIPFVQRAVDARRGTFGGKDQILYLWSGEQVRRLSPGLENVLADIYWLRTIQYFGGERAFAKEKKYELLEPLIEITTTLDPRFEMAYRYGAVFLAEPPPTGAGQPRAAVALLQRGSRALPDSWRIRQDLGFFHFFFLQDSQQAAKILLEAAQMPGAPIWLRTAAADFLRAGGERDASRRVWRHLYEETEGQMRDNALFNLQRLDALDGRDALQRDVEEFTRRLGRRPSSLGELAGAGLLRAPMVDPGGTPFAYDRESGIVSIARDSHFWRAS